MLESSTRDPAIKLFGQKIPLPGEAEVHPGDDAHSPAVMDIEEEEEEEEEEDREPLETEGEKDQGEKVRLLLLLLLLLL